MHRAAERLRQIRRLRRGFTLVEVLIALFIVAVAMGLAYEWIVRTAHLTSLNRERTLAGWVALNRIAEVRLGAERPSVGRSHGESELGTQTWRWELQVSETAVEELQRLDVTVSPAGAPQRQIITVTGFVGPNTPGPPPVDWYHAVGTAAGPGQDSEDEEDGDDEQDESEEES